MKPLMRLLTAALLLLAISPAEAAPKATSETECQYFWDVAITARALAMDGIGVEQTARIFAHMFDPKADARVVEIMRAIVIAAQHSRSALAGEFARDVALACVAKQGDMDGVLGTES